MRRLLGLALFVASASAFGGELTFSKSLPIVTQGGWTAGGGTFTTSWDAKRYDAIAHAPSSSSGGGYSAEAGGQEVRQLIVSFKEVSAGEGLPYGIKLVFSHIAYLTANVAVHGAPNTANADYSMSVIYGTNNNELLASGIAGGNLRRGTGRVMGTIRLNDYDIPMSSFVEVLPKVANRRRWTCTVNLTFPAATAWSRSLVLPGGADASSDADSKSVTRISYRYLHP